MELYARVYVIVFSSDQANTLGIPAATENLAREIVHGAWLKYIPFQQPQQQECYYINKHIDNNINNNINNIIININDNNQHNHQHK